MCARKLLEILRACLRWGTGGLISKVSCISDLFETKCDLKQQQQQQHP